MTQGREPPAPGPGDPRSRVWQVVAAIPPGRVTTYGRVADLAALPGRARWVGRVLRDLPQRSALPWFRVITATGRLAFPPGSDGFHRQQQALHEDGVPVRGGRVDLRRYGWPDA